MLDSIWQLLANYGLDTGEIADGIGSLITVTETTDADGNVVTEYGGTLGSLVDFPIIGSIIQIFASFAPAVEETVA